MRYEARGLLNKDGLAWGSYGREPFLPPSNHTGHTSDSKTETTGDDWWCWGPRRLGTETTGGVGGHGGSEPRQLETTGGVGGHGGSEPSQSLLMMNRTGKMDLKNSLLFQTK